MTTLIQLIGAQPLKCPFRRTSLRRAGGPRTQGTLSGRVENPPAEVPFRRTSLRRAGGPCTQGTLSGQVENPPAEMPVPTYQSEAGRRPASPLAGRG